MAESKKCAHGSCKCIVADGKHYCSQICEDSKDVTDIKCDCGHAACA
jgi:hypothetical protein